MCLGTLSVTARCNSLLGSWTNQHHIFVLFITELEEGDSDFRIPVLCIEGDRAAVLRVCLEPNGCAHSLHRPELNVFEKQGANTFAKEWLLNVERRELCAETEGIGQAALALTTA